MDDKKYDIDFLSIGDITTDAFIRLENAELTCDIDMDGRKLCVNFGDKIPYEEVVTVPAVGNSANATVAAARLGMSSALLTHVGNDAAGQECIDVLKENGVNTDFFIKQDGIKTNYHYVLSYGVERTILVRHNQFKYDFQAEKVNLPIPKLLYFSSIGEGALEYHNDIAKWVKDNNITMAFQPGTYQMKLGTPVLKNVYQATEYFFCNLEEAQKILETKNHDPKVLLKEIHELGPKIVFITDGRNGSYAYDSYEDLMYHQPTYPDPKNIVDRTGAGDSFSSTVSVALSMGKPVAEAMMWGPVNASSVIKYIGAREGLLQKDELLRNLNAAPATYRPTELDHSV